jgi:hypothetical protein
MVCMLLQAARAARWARHRPVERSARGGGGAAHAPENGCPLAPPSTHAAAGSPLRPPPPLPPSPQAVVRVHHCGHAVLLDHVGVHVDAPVAPHHLPRHCPRRGARGGRRGRRRPLERPAGVAGVGAEGCPHEPIGVGWSGRGEGRGAGAGGWAGKAAPPPPALAHLSARAHAHTFAWRLHALPARVVVWPGWEGERARVGREGEREDAGGAVGNASVQRRHSG